MPRRRQRSCFGLAIANYARNNEVRVVEHGAKRMAERIPEFATLMDRSWALR